MDLTVQSNTEKRISPTWNQEVVFEKNSKGIGDQRNYQHKYRAVPRNTVLAILCTQEMTVFKSLFFYYYPDFPCFYLVFLFKLYKHPLLSYNLTSKNRRGNSLKENFHNSILTTTYFEFEVFLVSKKHKYSARKFRWSVIKSFIL